MSCSCGGTMPSTSRTISANQRSRSTLGAIAARDARRSAGGATAPVPRRSRHYAVRARAALMPQPAPVVLRRHSPAALFRQRG
jgi:hypothetical protein